MWSRIRNVLFLLLGSFLVYCGQTIGHGGMAGNANAGSGTGSTGSSGGTCGCQPTRTTVFDGNVTLTVANPDPNNPDGSSCAGPAWDISQFGQIVIHGGNFSAGELTVELQYGKAGFVPLTLSNGSTTLPPGITTIPGQLGAQMRVASSGSACVDLQSKLPTLTIVGIQ